MSQKEVLGTPLGFQGRGKVKFTDVISSPITLFYYKNTLSHSTDEISGLLHIFLLLFPSIGWSLYHFNTFSPSAQGYSRNLCINNEYLRLWHFRSQFMCQCAQDTVNLITCVSTTPFSCLNHSCVFIYLVTSDKPNQTKMLKTNQIFICSAQLLHKSWENNQ